MNSADTVAECQWCGLDCVPTYSRDQFCNRNCASKWAASQSRRGGAKVRAVSQAIRGGAKVLRRSVDPVRVRDAVIARFKSKIAMPNSNGCRLWTASVNTAGYGAFKVGGVQTSAHRFAWALVNGQVPDGLFVCHTCDVPACCEISHLWLGTNADNMRDMAKKGRGCSGDRNRAVHAPMHGELNCNARLTVAEVLNIRESAASGVGYKYIAEKYGIKPSNVSNIATRRSWSHIP
jgi:hypothetical protein